MVAAAITVYFGSITPHSGANKKQRINRGLTLITIVGQTPRSHLSFFTSFYLAIPFYSTKPGASQRIMAFLLLIFIYPWFEAAFSSKSFSDPSCPSISTSVFSISFSICSNTCEYVSSSTPS